MKTRGFTQHYKNSAGFTLIEILVVIGIIAILAAIVIVAINPARQFAQARNVERTSDVNAILNAIGQYIVDNKGIAPAGISSTTEQQIEKAGGTDICSTLVPTYMAALPVDPKQVNPVAIIDCNSPYETNYWVSQNAATGRITVKAPATEISTTTLIQVTR